MVMRAECDWEDCRETGHVFTIVVLEQMKEVVLCDNHDAGLRTALLIGRTIAAPPSRRPPTPGRGRAGLQRRIING